MIADFLKWMFWRHLRRIVAKLPTRMLTGVVGLSSRFQMLLDGRRRRITSHELQASGLDCSRKTIRQSFKCQMDSWIKMCFLFRINRDNVRTYLPVDGLENVDAGLASGKGVVLLNPHFGPFLFALPALGYRGYKVNQVALQGNRPIGERRGLKKLLYEAQFNAVEGNMPVRFINAAENPMAIRDVIRTLGSNELVFFASTGRGGRSWHEVSFLGRKAGFNPNPFRIAARAGSAVLPVFVLDSPPLARVVIEKPLKYAEGDPPESMIEQYVSILSSYVKRYPDHFAFFLYDMHVKSWWDDHPFFSDYPNERAK